MKLVNFDQSKLLEPEKFYANGFKVITLDKNNVTLRMNEVMRELWDGQTREPFTWEQKGVSSFHLRPAAFEYDNVFLDFLFANNVPQQLEKLTGRKLHLCHIQVVKAIPGPSYQDWHRDAYQYGSDPIVGPFPSTVKVNFYPSFDQPEPRLRFIPGSHRCMANDAKFDALLLNKYEHEVLESNNERALIFESSMLHGVIPDTKSKGSIRLMYSFVMEHEYEKRFACKEHHKKLHDLYERMQGSLSHDALNKVKDYLKHELARGYDGNPYVNDLENELKYDGKINAFEEIIEHIECLQNEENTHK